MSRVRKCRWLPSALTLLLLASATLAAGHEQCQDCHAPGTPSASNLQRPLSGLCTNCHQARVDAGEHAVDIPATTAVAALPLQGGVMTCVTCHDPHARGLALRMTDPRLCEACHRR